MVVSTPRANITSPVKVMLMAWALWEVCPKVLEKELVKINIPAPATIKNNNKIIINELLLIGIPRYKYDIII